MKRRTKTEQIQWLMQKVVRRCLTMHACCLCDQTITLGQEYHDGGYGHRAHKLCVDNSALDSFIQSIEKNVLA